MIAIADYGMGNRRSVEKALAHVGARVGHHRRPRRIRAAHAIILPGVGAFPEAMRNLERTGLGEVLIERAAAGVPLLGICLGMQLLFESSHRARGRAGLGILPGHGHARCSRRACRTSAGTSSPSSATSALTEGLGDAAAFYHVHSFACRPVRRRRRRRDERVRRALRLRRRARQRHGQPVPPREVLPRRAAHAAQLRPARGGRRRMILYPAIDIMDGQAVRLVEGVFEDATTYHADPLDAAKLLGRGRRALPARRRPRRRPLAASRSRSTTCAGSSPRPASRSSTAAACAPSRPSARRCAPAPSARSSAPPRSRTSTSSTTSSPPTARGSSSPSTPRTA